MRVLITGDRDWQEYRPIYQVLKHLRLMSPDTIIVQGGARGADNIARHLASIIFGEAQVETHLADWTTHKKAAGPIRNRHMYHESMRRGALDGHPLKYGVAFHHHIERSKGTKDMISVLEWHNIPVLLID